MAKKSLSNKQMAVRIGLAGLVAVIFSSVVSPNEKKPKVETPVKPVESIAEIQDAIDSGPEAATRDSSEETAVIRDQETAEESSSEQDSRLVKVWRVIDGDTIEIEGGEKVRYIGIDTPETVHPSKPVECYGKEASDKNKALVEGKEVRLEKDVSETDKYGRLLRYVWVGDTQVNDYLVREGFAYSSSYPPDVRYQSQFVQAQAEAREAQKGLWGDYCSNWGNTVPSTVEPSGDGGGDAWGCNCSKTCSQMSSCEEAYYQLNTCGCSKRDGDDDGVPCESICL